MIFRILISLILMVFIYFNGTFIVDILFEDKLKHHLKIMEIPELNIREMRERIIQILPVIIILPRKLQILYILVLGYLYFKPYVKYRNIIQAQKAQLHYEFPIWIRSIQCHLQSSNVVVSIEKSYEYAPTLLKYHLKELIWQLSCDPHNIRHYQKFMSQYENLEIEKMMKILYRFNHMDQSNGEKHLDRMISSTSAWMQESRARKQEESLDRFSIFGILPVVSVSVYFLVMMTLVIMSMMEGGWM